VLLVVVLAVVTSAFAAPKSDSPGNPNPNVVPPQASFGGLTYSEWGDRWWAWEFSLPKAGHPNVDPTGAWAYAGQSGSLFLLSDAWNMSPPKAERSVTIGSGQSLLLPVATFSNSYADACIMDDGRCYTGQYDEAGVAATLQGCAATCADNATGLYAKVDGRDIKQIERYRRASTAVFPIPYPEDSIWEGRVLPWGTFGPQAGITWLAADGYYLLLAPLSVGEHTIVYGAANQRTQMAHDVVYHITVKPGR